MASKGNSATRSGTLRDTHAGAGDTGVDGVAAGGPPHQLRPHVGPDAERQRATRGRLLRVARDNLKVGRVAEIDECVMGAAALVLATQGRPHAEVFLQRAVTVTSWRNTFAANGTELDSTTWNYLRDVRAAVWREAIERVDPCQVLRAAGLSTHPAVRR